MRHLVALADWYLRGGVKDDDPAAHELVEQVVRDALRHLAAVRWASNEFRVARAVRLAAANCACAAGKSHVTIEDMITKNDKVVCRNVWRATDMEADLVQGHRHLAIRQRQDRRTLGKRRAAALGCRESRTEPPQRLPCCSGKRATQFAQHGKQVVR
jgi:hypothetical protein